MSKHEIGRGLYDAQGVLLNRMVEEMPGTIEHRAMGRVLRYLDIQMAKHTMFAPGARPAPGTLDKLLSEWYRFNAWIAREEAR